MPEPLIILLVLAVLFCVPFLFSIKTYENVRVLEKNISKGSVFLYYSFLIEKNGEKEEIAVCSDVYNSVLKGSTVTLYYNTGDEKVTGFKSSLES